MSDAEAITHLLHRLQSGEPEALKRLGPLVYQELRRIAGRSMRGERPGHTLQPTALVHEALLRLVGAEVEWRDRVHFYAVAARQMRRILVDHARQRNRHKRGGAAVHVALEDAPEPAAPDGSSMLELDQALRRLADHDPRKHDIVELHYFGGLTVDETAVALAISPKTVQRELRMAEAWLQNALQPAADT